MDDDVKSQNLRASRVARTEAALVAAARELFLDRGYAATSLTEITERAGLAARTVYVRFGSKAALFRRVVDEALVGDSEPIDVAHRPVVLRAMQAPTMTERVTALAEASVGIAERAGALFEVAAQAEGVEPEIEQAFQAGRAATATLAEQFWTAAARDGLVPNRRLAQLTTITDLLTCADTVVHLRRTGAWSARRYRALIIDTLTALVRDMS